MLLLSELVKTALDEVSILLRQAGQHWGGRGLDVSGGQQLAWLHVQDAQHLIEGVQQDLLTPFLDVRNGCPGQLDRYG